MDGLSGTHTSPADRRRPGPIVKAAVLVLALALLVFVGIRLYAWSEQAREARVVVLVNAWNDVDHSGFTPKLRELGDGFRVDAACRKPLNELLEACREAGFDPVLTAAYRSREEQQALFEQTVEGLLGQYGGDRQAAEEAAERAVARPGASEHELGLAVDLESRDGRSELMQQWLQENAWRYGFILRYPLGGEEITGEDYTPGHFRYVGMSAAGQIYALQITLEEYMGMFFSESAQIIFE